MFKYKWKIGNEYSIADIDVNLLHNTSIVTYYYSLISNRRVYVLEGTQ